MTKNKNIENSNDENDQSTIDKVNAIITKSELELKSVQVKKPIALEIDVGNLLAEDNNELIKEKLENNEKEEYLKEIARDAVQLILNQVWALQSETIDNILYAKLPKPSTRLPREKRVPKPKPPTKWEIYAKEKGISNQKKNTKVWDDILEKWIPRYGYEKVKAEKEKNWLIEVPGNVNPYEDMFEKVANKKKENIARNDYLRLQNLAKAKKIKLPSMGVTSENMSSRTDMQKALMVSRKSTASMGKFQENLKKESALKPVRGIKRKLPANDISQEGLKKDKTQALNILKKMKKGDIDLESAVNKQIKMENYNMAHKIKYNKSGRRSKMGGKSKSVSEHRNFGRKKKFSESNKKSNFSSGESVSKGKKKQSAAPQRGGGGGKGKSAGGGGGAKGKSGGGGGGAKGKAGGGGRKGKK